MSHGCGAGRLADDVVAIFRDAVPQLIQPSLKQGGQIVGEVFNAVGAAVAGLQALVFVEGHQHVARTALGGDHQRIAQGAVGDFAPVALHLVGGDGGGLFVGGGRGGHGYIKYIIDVGGASALRPTYSPLRREGREGGRTPAG